MNRFTFPAIIALATAGTVFAMTREAPNDEETSVKLPVAAALAPELAPFLLEAARDLGHSDARAGVGSVFIHVGDDEITFYPEKTSLTMRVGFDTKYRRTRAERDPALKALELKGQTIFEHAVSLQARAASKEQLASRASVQPAG